jgi:hypothetical protein
MRTALLRITAFPEGPDLAAEPLPAGRTKDPFNDNSDEAIGGDVKCGSAPSVEPPTFSLAQVDGVKVLKVSAGIVVKCFRFCEI